MANPFTVNVLGGQNLGGLLANTLNMREQRAQQEQAQQQQQEMMQLTKQASTGDPQAIESLFAFNPNLAMQFEQREAQKQQQLGAEQAALSNQAETDWGLRYVSASPEQREALKQEALNNPLIDFDESDLSIDDESGNLAVNAMLYKNLGKDAYQQFFGQAKKPMSEYEAALVESKQIDQDLRQQEIDLKKTQNAIKREKDELQKQRLEQDLAQKEQAIEAKKGEKASNLNASITASNSLVSSIDELLNNQQYLDDLTGVSGKLPTITPSGTDAEVAFDNLVNQLTLDNLGLMSGVLTDRDIQVLRSAAAGLEEGMTKGKFISQLKKIKSRTKSKINSAKKESKKLGVELPKANIADDAATPKIRNEAEIFSQYGVEL